MSGTASGAADFRTWLQGWLPRVVLAPSVAVTLLFVYGFIIFTVVLSFTGSKMLPNFKWVGLENYRKLWALESWHTAITNIAIFATLYIVHLHAGRPDAGDPSGPEDPRRGRAAADLSVSDGAVVHRDRDGVEMVSRPRHRA